MKSFFSQLLLACTILVLALSLRAVSIEMVEAKQIYLPFSAEQEGVKHLPQVGLTTTTEGTGANQRQITVGEGTSFLRKLVTGVGSFLSIILGAVAVGALFIAGYQLVTAQNAASEEMQKQKMNIVYICVGLVVFGLSGEVVYDYVFNEANVELIVYDDASQGVIGEVIAEIIGEEVAVRIKDILNLFLSFSGAGAILMLVIASLRLVVNPGDDEQIEKQKKIVGYTAVGIIMIGMAEILIDRVFFPAGGYGGVQVDEFERQLQGISNYVLGFLGIIIFVSSVISGGMMVINYGNEEMVNKVKTIMKNLVIGSLVSFSAYTVVATLLRTFLAAEQGAILPGG